jgi:hypothetical protein
MEKPLPDLVVTRGGVPVEDQAQGVRDFKAACQRAVEKRVDERVAAHKIYDHSRYDELVKQTVEMIVKLGKEKGGEYAGDSDRLANFRRNGAALELPMETIWRVYAGKHWDAVTQYIVDIQQGKTRPRMESIGGRIDDLIVYLILFKAMVDERGGATHDPRNA